MKLRYVGYAVIVLCIIMLLFTLFQGFLPSSKASKMARTVSEFRLIRWAFEEYYEENLKWPPELDALNNPPYTPGYNFLDPFPGYQEDFNYHFNERQAWVWSVGPDGVNSLAEDLDLKKKGDEIVLVLTVDEDGKISSRILE